MNRTKFFQKILVLSLFACTMSQASTIDDIKLMPDGKGKDLVISNCSACHSLKLLLQNRMTRQEWDKTITWMQEKQNLWPLSPEFRNDILNYLAANFAPSKQSPLNGFLTRPVNSLPEKVY